MKKNLIYLVFALSLVVSSAVFAASKLLEYSPNGYIDWEKATIHTNTGKKMDGLIQSLRLDSTTTVGELMLFDPGLSDEIPRGDDVPLYGDGGVATPIFAKVVNPEADKIVTPNSQVTGIIVNAQQSDFYPCLIPTWVGIFAPDQPYSLSAEVSGAVTYRRSMTEAKKTDIVGASPLVVTVQSVTGALKGSLGFSDADTQTLKQLETQYHLISLGKVVIVL